MLVESLDLRRKLSKKWSTLIVVANSLPVLISPAMITNTNVLDGFEIIAFALHWYCKPKKSLRSLN